jgi:uncharacterized protein
MLEMRPNCEHGNKDLPAQSDQAVICSFECTFCAACSQELLQGICPNCHGNLVPRPSRAESLLAKYTPSEKRVINPVDLVAHQSYLISRKV